MADISEIIVVGIYLVAMLGIGVWASRKIKGCEDFMCAGRSLGFWLFTLLMVGTVCSGMSLLGTSGFGYSSGWPGMWESLFVPLSISFCIIFFGTKLIQIRKTTNYVTVQDYLAHRFESPTHLRGLSAIAGIVVSAIYLTGQYTAISIVLIWLFGIPHWMALLIAAVIVALYTVIGGLYAVAWASLVQGIILIIGVLVMAPLLIMSAGGLTHINEVLSGIDPNLVQPWFPTAYTAYAFVTPEYLVSFCMLLVVGLACAPHVINNVLAVKESRYFRWTPIIAFLAYGAVMVLIKLSGFAGRVLVQEGAIPLPAVKNAQDFVFVYGIQHSLPSMYLWAVFAVIVLSAVMSTTDRLMLTIGSMCGWDIYKNIFRPQATDKQVLRVSQVTLVIAAALTFFLAINPPDFLASLIWMGIGIMLATFAVPLLAGLYWRGATQAGALAGMGAGLAASVICGSLSYFKFVKLPMHFSIYAVVVAFIVLVGVSLVTRKTSEKTLDETLTGWFIQPGKSR